MNAIRYWVRASRICAPLGTVSVQAGTMLAEPSPCLLVTRNRSLDEFPEAGPVIHLGEMGNLVRREIVQHKGRRENEPPGERQGAAGRAGAPARALVAHDDAGRR